MKGGGDALCAPSAPILIAQGFACCQKGLYAILRLFHATEAQECLPLEVKHLLLCNRRDGRTFAPGHNPGQVASNHGIMLTDLACKQQIFKLLLQYQASAWSREKQQRRLCRLP